MAKSWMFFGRNLPERFPVTMELPLNLVELEAISVKFKADIKFFQAEFIVRVWDIEGNIDIFSLRNVVETMVRQPLDYIGYLNGMAFDAVISSASSSEGDWQIFGPGIPGLAKISSAAAIPGEVLSAVFSPFSSESALADFRNAMQNAKQSGFYCFRAIEAIMQSFKSEEIKKESQAWNALRGRLLIERPVLDFIKSHADWARHGRDGNIQPPERDELLRLTSSIIERYIETLVHPEDALDSSRFQPLRRSGY